MTSILRELAARRPFRPFRLLYSDGSEVTATAPERIAFGVYTANGTNYETISVVTPDGVRHNWVIGQVVEVRIAEPLAVAGSQLPVKKGGRP